MILRLLLSIVLQTSVGVGPIQFPSVGPADFSSNRPSDNPSSIGGTEYRIGASDLLEVTVFEAADLSATTRVTAGGSISLRLLGSMNAAGQTPEELERSIESALQKHYLKDPHVQVFVREYASQPVSIVGAVKLPGIYQMKGQKSLVEMIAEAQGLDYLSAGRIIQVIRKGKEPDTPSQTITIDAEDLLQNGKAELNIAMQAGDVVNVLRAGSIFVVGEVVRPDEFVLKSGRDLTVTQAVARGGGFTKEAKRKECRIIRPHADGTKEEIPIDMAKVLAGSLNDLLMVPNDVLFVPSNKVKTGFNRALDTAITIAIGRAIYGGL